MTDLGTFQRVYDRDVARQIDAGAVDLMTIRETAMNAAIKAAWNAAIDAAKKVAETKYAYGAHQFARDAAENIAADIEALRKP